MYTHVRMFYTCTFRERDKFLSMLGVASTGASELIYVAVEPSHISVVVLLVVLYTCATSLLNVLTCFFDCP